MGKQILFFMTAEDEREFAQFVLQDPDVLFIERQTDTSDIVECAAPGDPDRGLGVMSPALGIWNKRICPRVTMVKCAPGSFWARADHEELVEFSRCNLHGRTMLAGRLYMDMHFLNETQTQLIRKNPEFEKWYNRLAGWIRRHYARDPKYGDKIGPRALEAYKNGAIELAEHLTPNGPI
jgi:hypothetical protein